MTSEQTPEQIAQARKVITYKRWRWMPGMRWAMLRAAPLENYYGRICDRGLPPASGAIPDLSDPATLGCMLALVRELYGDPGLYVRLSQTTRESDGIRAWEVVGWLNPAGDREIGGPWRSWGFASEAEALCDTIRNA